jgi:hypothetical protein
MEQYTTKGLSFAIPFSEAIKKVVKANKLCIWQVAYIIFLLFPSIQE